MPLKTKYQLMVEPNLDVIAAWVRDGLSLDEISKKLKIAPSTLKRYISEKPEMAEIFRENRERCDLVRVVGAYKRRAEGYTVCEKTRHYRYENGQRILVDEYEKEKHIPADVRAAENWIRLRMKEHPIYGRLGDILKENKEGQEQSDGGGVVFMPQQVEIQEPIEYDLEIVEKVVDKDG